MKQKMAALALLLIAIGAGFFFGLEKPKLDELKNLQGKLDKITRRCGGNTKTGQQSPQIQGRV